MNKKYDIVLVGSGLHNAVFARLATNMGLKCLVVEKRNHIGGNCYDEVMDGINVHMYGPHIFHTNYDDVWKFLNMYTTFNNFINQPIAKYWGETYNLPFNMNTFSKMWSGCNSPSVAKLLIDEQRLKLKIDTPKNLEEQALLLVGKDIYEKLIKEYTEKQWGKDCTELPPEIIKRLPVRFTFNNNYFNDKYQGIPDKGYKDLFDKLFEGCDIMLETDFFKCRDELMNMCNTLVYSGEIDRFFGYVHGKLEYRSLRFEHEKYDIQNYQGVAVVNYTDKIHKYTRTIEHKHFDVWNEDVQNVKHTIVTKEYPINYDGGMDTEPYYPISNQRNQEIYEKYKEMGESLPDVIFGGRLGEYKYYDMDKVVKSAMTHFDEYMKKKDNS